MEDLLLNLTSMSSLVYAYMIDMFGRFVAIQHAEIATSTLSVTPFVCIYVFNKKYSLLVRNMITIGIRTLPWNQIVYLPILHDPASFISQSFSDEELMGTSGSERLYFWDLGLAFSLPEFLRCADLCWKLDWRVCESAFLGILEAMKGSQEGSWQGLPGQTHRV